MKITKWKTIYILLTFAAIVALSCFVFLSLYQWDNKYTEGEPQATKGVLDLTANPPEDDQIHYLVDGWEYYEDVLLRGDEKLSEPDEYIYIGQYGGLDAGNFSRSPHGNASYRITINLPKGSQTYMLELPEIHSAYKAYINGDIVQSMGQTDPSEYYPETGNRTVTIEAKDKIEILIAVSDYSDIYSGMIHPPAFGTPNAVSDLLTKRLIVRSIFVATAIIIGILAVFTGILNRKNLLASLYGILCLAFAGFTGYTIWKTIFSGYYLMYTIERFSFCVLLTVLIALSGIILNDKTLWSRILMVFGFFMCAFSLVSQLIFGSGSIVLMGVYSYMIMAFEWITAIYLTVITTRAVIDNIIYSKLLLCGLLVFDASLVMDRLLPLYEPQITGWFPEIGSFILILFIGAAVGKQIAEKYRSNFILEERSQHMERLSKIQRTNYELLMERVEETKVIQHDLKHHSVMMNQLLQNKDYEGLESYINKLSTVTHQMQPLDSSKNIVADALTKHYKKLAEGNEITMKAEVGIKKDIPLSDADMCAILSNLLDNSMEACLRQTSGKRYINLNIGQMPSVVSIRVENSTDGNISENSNTFVSSKSRERQGYGLVSIKRIAELYDGSADFSYDNQKKVFIANVLLYLTEATK